MSEVLYHHGDNTSGVHFTTDATRHILSYLKKQHNAKGVRFSVKKTGCSGLAYMIDYVEQHAENDIELPFVDGYVIFIEKKSYPYLKGLQIDYIKQGLSYKLTFNNPNQTGQCGCGESFTVD